VSTVFVYPPLLTFDEFFVIRAGNKNGLLLPNSVTDQGTDLTRPRALSYVITTGTLD
jgi:hypothetical protein